MSRFSPSSGHDTKCVSRCPHDIPGLTVNAVVQQKSQGRSKPCRPCSATELEGSFVWQGGIPEVRELTSVKNPLPVLSPSGEVRLNCRLN